MFPFRATVSNRNRIQATYLILIFLVAALIKVKRLLHLIQSIQNINILLCNYYENSEKTFYILSVCMRKAFEIWCVRHTYSKSLFGPAIPHVPNSYVVLWLLKRTVQVYTLHRYHTTWVSRPMNPSGISLLPYRKSLSYLQASEISLLTVTPALCFRQCCRTKHIVLVKEGTEKIKATTCNKKDIVTYKRSRQKFSKPFWASIRC